MIAAAVQKFSLESLPGRYLAEERMGEAVRSGRPLCPLALAVDSYPVIVGHFGHQGGDEAMGRVAGRLPLAHLYRWTAATFLVLLETPDTALLLLNALPNRYTVKLFAGDGMVEVPYSARSKVFPAQPAEPASGLARRIDRWVATPWID
jgi:GGDEF domain-containing protein